MQTSYNTKTIWKVVKLDSSGGTLSKSYSEIDYESIEAAQQAAVGFRELPQFKHSETIEFEVEVKYVPI